MLASSAQGLSSQVSPQNCLANMLYRQCLWLLLTSSSVQVGIKLSVAHVSCWVPLRAGSPHWNTRWVGKEKTRSCWALMTLCSLCRVPVGPAVRLETSRPLCRSTGALGCHLHTRAHLLKVVFELLFKWVAKVREFLYSWDISFSSHRNKPQQMCFSSTLIQAPARHTAENGNSSN